MKNETLRALLGMKLNRELRLFRDEELALDKDTILGDCFRINMYIVIYEILFENLDGFSRVEMKSMLNQPDNIIQNIYEKWIDKNGDDYLRIKEFVIKEVA